MKTMAIIRRRIKPGVYLVADRSGRAHRAESQETYRPGQSVVVLDGQIVGLAAKEPSTTTFEV